MHEIKDLLKNYRIEKINILPKKEAISKIAQKVKLVDDSLKNWKIIAYQLRSLSPDSTTRLLNGLKFGTRTDTSDIKGAYLNYVKTIKNIKKPKQLKLL